MPAGELGKTSLRISKNWRVDMCEVERNQGKKIQKVQLLHFLISRKNCTRVLWLAEFEVVAHVFQLVSR